MSMYCYVNDKTGHKMQRAYPAGKAPKVIRYEGFKFRRDYEAEHVGVPPTKGWPIECIGSGVHADQAGELRDHFKKHNVSVPVSKDGNPIYANATQRRKALKCRGLVDKASFS